MDNSIGGGVSALPAADFPFTLSQKLVRTEKTEKGWPFLIKVATIAMVVIIHDKAGGGSGRTGMRRACIGHRAPLLSIQSEASR